MERSPFPENLISWLDIAKGIGDLAIGTLTRHLHYEGLSDHFIHPLDTPIEPVTELPGQ